MKKLIVIVVLIILAVIAWIWFGGNPRVSLGTEPQAQGEQSGFGGTLYGKIPAGNPATQLPETNPFKTDINPFSGAYKNPFGQ